MMFTENGRKRFTAILLAALLLLSTAAPALAETFSAIVTASSMAVYSDGKLTKQAGTLPRDTVVRITSYDDKAARITYGGKTGYARTRDMQAVEDVAAHAVTNTTATVYQQPMDTARHSTVRKGTRLYVLAWTDEWARVEKSGVVGYIRAGELTAVGSDWKITVTPTAAPVVESERGTVTASSLTVYEKAATASKKLGKLKKGDVVNVITWDSKWAYIELDGNYGYCSVRGLTRGTVEADDEEEQTGLYAPVRVTVSRLTVYQKASASSRKLGTIKKGQVVSLMGKTGDWAHIELNGREGYCDASGLGVVPMASPAPTPTPEPEADALRGLVIEDTLTVYKSASTGARKLLELEAGDIVEVLKWTDKWAYIEYGGNKGYVKLSGIIRTNQKPAVSPDAKATATPAPTKVPSLAEAEKATVIEESAMVYKQPDSASQAMGALMWGDSVNLLSTSDGWALIEKDGKYGYCRASAVSAVAPDADELPSGYKKADFTATVIHPDAMRYVAESTSGEGTALALGATVNVTGYDEDLEWATIAVNNELAYVPIKYLSNAKYDTATSGSAMQTVLKALLSYGYFDGLPSTADSAAASTAIRRFQEAVGMEQTGVADEAVQRVLFSGNAPTSAMLADPLSKGAVGDNVTRLQYRLYALGYLSKSASLDGDFGSNTAAAVSLFQKSNGIEQSGSADATTLKLLYSPTAVAKPSGTKAADATASASSSSASASSSTNKVETSGTVKLSSTYVTTMPSQLKSSTSSYSSGLSASQKLEYVIYVAQSNLGKPYVYGATGTSSFDCSGLTQYCFKKGGVSLKRTAYSQGYDSTYTKISSISSLKRGDLIFFNTISDSDLCDHVGIYLGGNCFIHASSGGHKVVVSSVASGYYNRVFSWGRRIIK